MSLCLPQSNVQEVQTNRVSQAWIASPLVDLTLIIGPAFFITAAVFAFPTFFSQANSMPLWLWAVLILGVDVAHVYATLFRTYFSVTPTKPSQALLIGLPLVCWLGGALLYAIDGLLFWRALTSLAVFHFIRQQYGFMAIYARTENQAFRAWRGLDTALIYLSMLYPLVDWHVRLPRAFNWFVEGDFLTGLPLVWLHWVGALYALVGVAYVIKELILSVRYHQFHWPKNLLMLGTALSWAVGIVQFNGDLIFTATNVISHGIPYMALVWLTNRAALHSMPATAQAPKRNQLAALFQWAGIPVYLLLLWFLAWLEEGAWDGFIWREHGPLFALAHWAPFAALPHVVAPETLTWLVPLLALPQAAHYLLDGFIWRLK